MQYVPKFGQVIEYNKKNRFQKSCKKIGQGD